MPCHAWPCQLHLSRHGSDGSVQVLNVGAGAGLCIGAPEGRLAHAEATHIQQVLHLAQGRELLAQGRQNTAERW